MVRRRIFPVSSNVVGNAGRASAAKSNMRSLLGKRSRSKALSTGFMAGNKPSGVVIQERDRHLLRELAVMRVIDRDQAKRVAGFGSTTQVNARLLRLTRAGLRRRFFLG